MYQYKQTVHNNNKKMQINNYTLHDHDKLGNNNEKLYNNELGDKNET